GSLDSPFLNRYIVGIVEGRKQKPDNHLITSAARWLFSSFWLYSSCTGSEHDQGGDEHRQQLSYHLTRCRLHCFVHCRLMPWPWRRHPHCSRAPTSGGRHGFLVAPTALLPAAGSAQPAPAQPARPGPALRPPRATHLPQSLHSGCGG